MAYNRDIKQGSNGNYYDLSIVPDIYVVGKVGHPSARIVRIVHMSDTHDRHEDYIDRIPKGHIFVHSGDFGNYSLSRQFFKDRDFQRHIDSLNAFFDRLPHAYKIFVPGNHDLNFDRYTPEYIQSKLTSGIYLQDSSCTLFGLNFYGTPWNLWRVNSWARGFATDWSNVCKQWRRIPSSTDVLISHIPPWSRDLYNIVTKDVKPVLHLFGHVHGDYGIKWKDKVLFSNAAMAQSELPADRPNNTARLPSGSAGGSSGSCNSTAYRNILRRNPIVVDVYVVADDFECVLPSYHPRTLCPQETVHCEDCDDDQCKCPQNNEPAPESEAIGSSESTVPNGHAIISPHKSSQRLERSQGSKCTVS